MQLFIQRAAGVLVALLFGLMISTITPADAWAQPMQLDPAETPGDTSTATPPPRSPPVAAPAPPGREGFIALADFGVDNPQDVDSPNAERRAHPRSLTAPTPATPASVSGNTPVVDWQLCVRRYGEARCAQVWGPARGDNARMCLKGAAVMKQLGELQISFGTSEEDLAFLQSVYEELPDEVKRATRIMQVGQAGQAGALCVLSAGFYCIGAVSGAVGNVVVAEANLKVSLMHIKLSIANIVLTRNNIRLQMITVELNGMWVPVFMPLCVNMGYITEADIIATERPNLPPVDSQLLRRDREKRAEREARREERRERRRGLW